MYVGVALPCFALLLFAASVCVLNYRQLTNNDFWFHLRVGEDLLSQRSFPRVDNYSAVAHGRPFIAHGWLADVLFALIYRSFGAFGFLLLREALALSLVSLLYLSLTKELRWSPVSVPIMALCTYMICWRIGIRPLAFSLLLIGVVGFAIERWRSSRLLRDLIWLVPVLGLWANLHGSFLFGVVLLLAVGGSCGVMVLVPRLQRVGMEDSYSWKDVFNVAGVALGALCATLVNPYGFELIRFSFEMSEANEFIKKSMSEWHGPFDSTSFFRDHSSYLFWLYCGMLALLWSGLILRLRERPFLDFILAAVVTLLSIRANRFIPHVAIIGFPIMVRSWDRLVKIGLRGRYDQLNRNTVWIAVAVAGLLLTIAVSGYAYGPRNRGRSGWKFGGTTAYEAISFIKKEGLKGTIFNQSTINGSYIIHELYPNVRPVMDARLDVYGKELYEEYSASKASIRRLHEYLSKHDVSLALVSQGGDIAKVFERHLDWQKLYETNDYLVFRRAPVTIEQVHSHSR